MNAEFQQALLERIAYALEELVKQGRSPLSKPLIAKPCWMCGCAIRTIAQWCDACGRGNKP